MRAWRSLLLVFALFVAWTAVPVQAQDDGPAFLVISVSDTAFDISGLKANGPSAGSSTITVRIGTFSSGGDGVTDTVFTPYSDFTAIPLPTVDKYGNLLDPTTLGSHEATIFGSFEAYDANSVLQPHVMTTTSTGIDPAIQAAVVAAAADLDAAIADDPFMTTGQIADIVHKKLPKSSKITLDQVAAAIFDTDEVLAAAGTTSDPLVESEGDLFPHAPGSGALFTYKFTIDKDGGYSSDFCRIVEVKVSENSVNVDKDGVLPVVVLSDPGFAAADVSWVKLNGVSPSSSSLSDQNGDGLDDLVVKFDVPTLVNYGVPKLSKSTKTVTLTGELDDGTCIVGTSAINTK